jgi:hypothetical protein
MASPESWRQQSMLYLLGELDAEQTRFVEQQLEAFPELGEDLLRQADLIAGLSQAALVPTLPRAAETHPSVTRWPLVASMVAVAACLAILVFGVKPSASDRDTVAAQSGSSAKMSKTSHREDLLIARAWASHQRSVADDLGFVEPDVDEALAITAEDDSLVNESTLSWMFMAVSANSELLASGVRNDG